MVRDFINLFSEHMILVPLAFIGLLVLIDEISCAIINIVNAARGADTAKEDAG